MRLSSIGLIGGAFLISAASAAPSFAGNPASISGSTTFISPAGFTSTVSGEAVLPSGFYFPTAAAVLTDSDIVTGAKATINDTGVAAIVLPQFSLQGFSVAAESLSIASGAAVTAIPAGSSSSFSSAAAQVLTNAARATAALGSPTEGRVAQDGLGATVYASGNIEFISAIIKAGAGVNGLD